MNLPAITFGDDCNPETLLRHVPSGYVVTIQPIDGEPVLAIVHGTSAEGVDYVATTEEELGSLPAWRDPLAALRESSDIVVSSILWTDLAGLVIH